MLRKLSLLAILLLSTATFCLAEGDDSSYALSVLPDRKAVCSGDTVHLHLGCQYPAGRYLAHWSVGAYRRTLPASFQQMTGLKYKDNGGNGSWDRFTMKAVWLSSAFHQARTLDVEFATDNWPPGDYALECAVLLRKTGKPEVKTDKYLKAKFYLTISNTKP